MTQDNNEAVYMQIFLCYEEFWENDLATLLYSCSKITKLN
jgi:hypothetical protein